jgi:hypothetical protein
MQQWQCLKVLKELEDFALYVITPVKSAFVEYIFHPLVFFTIDRDEESLKKMSEKQNKIGSVRVT